MCGIELLVFDNSISFSLWEDIFHLNSIMQKRGPNYQSIKQFYKNKEQNAWVGSSVLHLRGKTVTKQPLCNNNDNDIINNNFLCWNGEIFSGNIKINENENDGILLFNELNKASLSNNTKDDIPKIMSSIHGPYAFCYWDVNTQTLWFGRDPIGRRSLLLHRSNNNDDTGIFLLCSSLSKELEDKYPMEQWIEVPCDNIYSIEFPISLLNTNVPEINLETSGTAEDINQILYTHYFKNIQPHSWIFNNSCRIKSEIITIQKNKNDKPFELTIPEMYLPYGTRSKNIITNPNDHSKEEFENIKKQFIHILGKAVKRRVKGIPNSNPLPDNYKYRGGESRLGIMFSGGIDSMLVATLATKYFTKGEPIDLLNVAFGSWPFSVPDRETGRKGLKELQEIDPERQWNFVEINITKDELELHQDDLYSCVFPRITVMDMTIGPALWFGARGKGIILKDKNSDISNRESYEPYISTSKVLLMGNGADEQLGGYGRHRTAHKHRGMEGLQLELNKDISRIWIRNLGRDDRIISSLSKESRYPFLDYNFINFLNSTPIGLICDFSKEPGEGDKRILRESAKDLGLTKSTRFAKRAIQFGCRISHLTKRKQGGHIKFNGYTQT